MTRVLGWLMPLALLLCLVACGGDEPATEGGPSTPAVTPPAADPMATPRGSIEHQLALLKAQKVDELRACFTPRQQKGITAEAVARAQEELASYTMDDLYASEVPGEWEGKKTTKIKMKNGRSLTTLVLTDGKWLADTIWFK